MSQTGAPPNANSDGRGPKDGPVSDRQVALDCERTSADIRDVVRTQCREKGAAWIGWGSRSAERHRP